MGDEVAEVLAELVSHTATPAKRNKVWLRCSKMLSLKPPQNHPISLLSVYR